MLRNSDRTPPRGRRIVGLAASVLLLGLACTKDHSLKEVLSPSEAERGIPRPAALTAQVGNRQVQLSWVLDDSSHASQVQRYRVYRHLANEPAILTDSTASATPTLTVGGLINGVPYFFSVSAVTKGGQEGRRSDEVVATPGAYGVLIENGKEAVNTSSVRLSLVAPQGVSGVRISNSRTDLPGAPVQPYATTIAWQLLPPDGEKTVYVQFIDAQGNAAGPDSDQVRLDTVARIQAVTFSPADSVQPGDTVHFTVVTGEPDGKAQIELGNGLRTLDLYDNGTNGDAVADDGTYSLDYTVEQDITLAETLVTGHFTDRAGNVADPVVAPGRLDDQPPHAVTLNQPTSFDQTSVLLTWSQSQELDFASYKLYRSLSAGINGTGNPVATLPSVQTTSYTDTGLTENTTYYYRVFVVDRGGHATGSAEERKVTTANADPDTVSLTTAQPQDVGGRPAVSLGWTISTVHDFKEYDLYRGTSPAVGTQDVLVRAIPDSMVLSHVDEGLTDNTRYYYRIFVKDTQSATAGSAARAVVTENLAPSAVTLSDSVIVSVGEIELTWTANADHDFWKYAVLKGRQPGALTDSLATFYQKTQTKTAFYTSPSDTTRYFFKVVVFDRGVPPNTNLSTDSNVVSARVKQP